MKTGCFNLMKFKFAWTLSLFCMMFLACSGDKSSWNNTDTWTTSNEIGCFVTIKSVDQLAGFCVHYDLSSFALKPGYGWISVERKLPEYFDPNIPITLTIKTEISESDLEIKFIDKDGSVFGKKVALSNYSKNWNRLVFSIENLDYWWGGDQKFDGFGQLALAISGRDSGWVCFRNFGLANPDDDPSFEPGGPRLDSHRELAGFGMVKRRDSVMVPEDPLILKYLQVLQDSSSARHDLLPSMENDEAHTFNNALVAMAFILKGEKERAERILDFFKNATDKNNRDIRLQNFYVDGEARGFYQMVNMKTRRDELRVADRWMGDMAWLLVAYKYYEYTYNSDKYAVITTRLKNLLKSYYKPAEFGGYIQHGWRNGDQQLHYRSGHPEGNIDCYAAFRLCGETKLAGKIKTWLDHKLDENPNLFIDLYSWRVLAFGRDYSAYLDIPEYDLRFRKTIEINGKPVVGFFHRPDYNIENFWIDGIGQMACAFISCGGKYRGYFYANQLDKLIFEKRYKNQIVHALPYTVNHSGGYEWVNFDSGFISTIAWYIFAKNEFNPLRFDQS